MNYETTYNRPAITGKKGTCPVCFDVFSVRDGRTIVRHGFRKSSKYGFQHGYCSGWDKLALEVSDSGAIEALVEYKANTAKAIEAGEVKGDELRRLQMQRPVRIEYVERTVGEWQENYRLLDGEKIPAPTADEMATTIDRQITEIDEKDAKIADLMARLEKAEADAALWEKRAEFQYDKNAELEKKLAE